MHLANIDGMIATTYLANHFAFKICNRIFQNGQLMQLSGKVFHITGSEFIYVSARI